MKNKLIFLLLFAVTGNLIFSNPDHDLLVAIKRHDAPAAIKALEAGADSNFHGQTSASDLSCTDWTPLMKAIAQLGSSIILSQSYMNSVADMGKYLFLGSSSFTYFLTSPIVKSYDTKTIDEQYQIVQLLLADTLPIRSMLAATISALHQLRRMLMICCTPKISARRHAHKLLIKNTARCLKQLSASLQHR